MYEDYSRPRGSTEYVPLAYDAVLRETEKAFLFRLENEDVWVPKSQMEDPEGCSVGETDGEVSVTRWIAEQKGLDF